MERRARGRPRINGCPRRSCQNAWPVTEAHVFRVALRELISRWSFQIGFEIRIALLIHELRLRLCPPAGPLAQVITPS